MSVSQSLMQIHDKFKGETYEKIITQNDLSGLTSMEKVMHITNLCDSLELNPLTKPIQLIKFQGKEIIYFTKDATEQLRKNNKVSINNIETKMLDGDIYIVTAYASTPDGRIDSSTGVINIKNKAGDDLCNAMMKAETKAKRRVTLSICGVGHMDESEADSIPNATKINIYEVKEKERDPLLLNDFSTDLNNAKNMEELQDNFQKSYKYYKEKKDSEAIKKLIEAKDKRKEELTSKTEVIDVETGEIQ